MSNIETIYEEARKSYILKLPEKFNEINMLKNKLSGNNKDINLIKEFYILIHSISGASGMLGFSDLSESCQKLESYLIKIIKSNLTIEMDFDNIVVFVNKIEKTYTEIIKS